MTTYKYDSDKSKKCLSVSNSGILSVIVVGVVVVCVLAPFYPSLLSSSLEYLQKVRYIILVDPLFWFSRLLFSEQIGNTALCLKNISITFFRYFHTLFLTIHFWIVVSSPRFHWLSVCNQYIHTDISICLCQMKLQVMEHSFILLYFFCTVLVLDKPYPTPGGKIVILNKICTETLNSI